MKPEKFVLLFPIIMMLFSYILVSLFMQPFLFALKEGIFLLLGAVCMLALIALKKENMGRNKTTVFWALFVCVYAVAVVQLIDPMAWGTAFYIIMIPFISDRVANRPYRKFDATKL